ncbi:MAG: A/G-specific adenine glycosylase [Acidobacteriota bacterium]
MTERRPSSEAAELLEWYDRQRRDLPWRKNKNPYRIWVSEIMLQQTQVKTVLPYYEVFLEHFPTVEALAAAPIDDVLARWSGLGYYRRARQMHRAAVQLVEEGRPIPRTAEALEELPGIGAYTAAAIASIAFGEAVPVLDGNVERVMARRLALEEDPKKRAGRERLLAAAADLLDPERAGDSNQAFMELGATVCRPKAPKCLLCPLGAGCLGKGDAERYPPPRKRRKVERVELAVAVVREEGRLLLFRRPEGGVDLMPGLWELPTVPLEGGEALSDRLAGRYGGSWTLEATKERVRHGITHRSITLHLYLGAVEARDDSVGEGLEAAWVSPEARDRFATSSVVDKVLSRLP